jgi:uncharacterized protein YndB with AHSA1/START domain
MADEVIVIRTFDAPRDLVWKAWTQPERFKRWWGPKDFTTPVAKMDVRVGGEFLGCMRSSDGHDYWSKGVYREIVRPERLVMTDSFADEEGHTVPASYYSMGDDWPLEMLVSVTLEERDGKTKLTLKHSGIEGFTDTDLENMRQGWNESFDKLDDALESWKQESARAA